MADRSFPVLTPERWVQQATAVVHSGAIACDADAFERELSQAVTGRFALKLGVRAVRAMSSGAPGADVWVSIGLGRSSAPQNDVPALEELLDRDFVSAIEPPTLHLVPRGSERDDSNSSLYSRPLSAGERSALNSEIAPDGFGGWYSWLPPYDEGELGDHWIVVTLVS